MLVRKNKGITLIEVIVCMFVTTVIILMILTFYRVNLQSRLQEEKLRTGLFRVDAVKNLIICNLSYGEVQKNFKDKTLYIHKGNIESDNIVNSSILSVIESTPSYEFPFIRIETEEDIEQGVMKFQVYYYFQVGKEISNVFFKGNYEKE